MVFTFQGLGGRANIDFEHSFHNDFGVSRRGGQGKYSFLAGIS